MQQNYNIDMHAEEMRFSLSSGTGKWSYTLLILMAPELTLIRIHFEGNDCPFFNRFERIFL